MIFRKGKVHSEVITLKTLKKEGEK